MTTQASVEGFLMMFAKPTGVHRFHRWLNGVFGKLPSEN